MNKQVFRSEQTPFMGCSRRCSHIQDFIFRKLGHYGRASRRSLELPVLLLLQRALTAEEGPTEGVVSGPRGLIINVFKVSQVNKESGRGSAQMPASQALPPPSLARSHQHFSGRRHCGIPQVNEMVKTIAVKMDTPRSKKPGTSTTEMHARLKDRHLKRSWVKGQERQAYFQR